MALELSWVQDMLKKNPSLTIGHFCKCGGNYTYLKRWEAEGLVKFGVFNAKERCQPQWAGNLSTAGRDKYDKFRKSPRPGKSK